MTTRICTLFAALALATPALAQEVVDSVLSDLNGDGLRERFTLLHDGDGMADLIVEDTGFGRVTVPNIVWIGGIGQEPDLDLAANGSVRLASMNESIGRNRWRQTLTIAWRGGAYRVAGYTYEWYDTLDLSDSGSCDLNLLNGKGFVSKGDGPRRAVRHDLTARPITAWSDDQPIPEVCGAWE